VNRVRVWLVVSPVVAAGVLVAHTLAYDLTSTPTDPFHAYLAHAPQVLLLLAVSGVVLAGFGPRREALSPAAIPLAGFGTFVAQEHVERILHGGGIPILVTSSAFLVGLALQIPVGVLAWLLARWLLGSVCPCERVSARPQLAFLIRATPIHDVAAFEVPARCSRGPPTPLPSG
jgi:hypothetical protein